MSDLNVQPGRYHHFKGQNYIVLGVALHSETQKSHDRLPAGLRGPQNVGQAQGDVPGNRPG